MKQNASLRFKLKKIGFNIMLKNAIFGQKRVWPAPWFPDGVGPKNFIRWFSGPKGKMLSKIESD